ncbi:hypothetical protein J5069_07375 [Candidatus Symbiopectobacterium sp. NZEC127]|uniref:hypothetical protein n=1 Tax=Candidatus Symbiopectobacterium sp. NZEC127 TaxID=2820472 RepID=UPI0022279264|nr:hypothetical protein [Candidatus Symbiopectobacterium sp. NZEC127]MCW2485716.1 hypothetical protein [Candidatus Symbiopectobacterium sp. NZEC127]
MSKNWMRHFDLQIVDGSGEGVQLSDFKVVFSIEWADTRWPRVANVKIYNLSPDTNNKILREEFTRIRLIAGYDGIVPDVKAADVGIARNVNADDVGHMNDRNYGLIFDGDIRFSITGQDNITDKWIQVQAIDGWDALLRANLSMTIMRGWTMRSLFDEVMKEFNKYGVTEGTICDMPPTVYPRGISLFSPASDVMDQIAKSCNATWQIVEGKVNVISQNDYIHEAIVLNADTGLVGMPQQTMGGGVNVRCLINPNIRINGLVHIDQASVYRAGLSDTDVARSGGRINEVNQDGNLTLSGALQNPASIAADGVYVVKAIDYHGDTRGQAWYMDLMCFARGDRTLLSKATLDRAHMEK